MGKKLTHEERLSLAGSLIDVFEDFLDERKIIVDNPEKAESDCPSTIYGTDYFGLEEALLSMLEANDIIDKENENRNITVGDLSLVLNTEICKNKDFGKLEVVVPIIDDEDNIKIHGFYNVNSIVVIDDGAGNRALLLAPVQKGKTIEEELKPSCATIANKKGER